MARAARSARRKVDFRRIQLRGMATLRRASSSTLAARQKHSYAAQLAPALGSSRAASSSSSPSPRRNEPRYNYIANPFDSTPDPDHETYRRVTAKDVANRTSPPRRVKMLARDFVDDCLYNPNYGYFSTQAVIFDPDEIPKRGRAQPGENALLRTRAEGFDFARMRNSRAFEDEIARRYGEFEAADPSGGKGPGRQVWHTPTELFKVRSRPHLSRSPTAKLTSC